MKKFNLGLLNAFTIIISITTVFTTKSSPPKLVHDYEVWSIISDAVRHNDYDCAVLTPNFMTKLYDGGVVPPVGLDNDSKLFNAVINYNNSHNPDFSCSVDVIHMCVAYVNSSLCAVLAADDGDANF